MIDPVAFHSALAGRGVSLYTGVPDSTLKSFCTFLSHRCGPREHIITANEGNAVGVAAGYHLATGGIAAVYMQNSGLGNAINPLTSLTAPEVYRIPMLLIIGWRGEPGTSDEPQHVNQGRITCAELELLGIPFRIMDSDSGLDQLVRQVFKLLAERGSPVALLVRNNTFLEYRAVSRPADQTSLLREQMLSLLLEIVSPDDVIIATTGKTSRELFELRVRRGEKTHDFLVVGSMGHASSIALGASLGVPHRRVICLDGDGALLMHMGALPVIGGVKPHNLVHVLLNNASHESVGGQPTVAGSIDFAALSHACGYRFYHPTHDEASLRSAWRQIVTHNGPVLLEIQVRAGSRKDLGRPTASPVQNKHAFMQHVLDGGL